MMTRSHSPKPTRPKRGLNREYISYRLRRFGMGLGARALAVVMTGALSIKLKEDEKKPRKTR